jgi:hypothetical protein
MGLVLAENAVPMPRSTLVILEVALAATLGCGGGGTTPGTASGTSTGASGTTSTGASAGASSGAASSGSGQCGCSLAPLCGLACNDRCGCCSCLPGEPLTVGGQPYQCRADTVCYEAIPSDASSVSDVVDAALIKEASAGDGPAADGDSGAIPCGGQTCASDEVCVQWACGGGPPMGCAPLDDAGGCPAGWAVSSTACGATVGCVAPPCTNPPPSCAKAPKGCTFQDCTCFGAAVCGGSDRCGASSATYVLCGNP